TEFILPAYVGSAVTFELGAVEASIDLPLSLSFEKTSPLAALRMIEEAAADGTGCEAQFRLRADGTGYIVDLLERVGKAAGGAELRYRKNIDAISRTVDERHVETRIYAYGEGLLTLADAHWKIAGVGAGVITFEGESPVFEDDALVGMEFVVPGKDAYPVTASVAGGTITVDTTGRPALAADDVGYFAHGGGQRLEYLESPAGVQEYRTRVGQYTAPDVPDARNLLGNGDFSEWAAGLPVGWALEGTPIVTEQSDPRYLQQGSRLAHVLADAANEGLVSEAFAIEESEDRPYIGILTGLTVISGHVRMELRHSNGRVYPIQQRPQSEGLGVYLTLSAGPAHDEPLPAGTAQLALVSHGGAAEFYLDCAMVTPQLASAVPAFVLDSGAHLLWRRTAIELADRRQPQIEYLISVLDLHEANPDLFVFDELDLGDDVKVRDPQIGRETQRIVEITQDLLLGETTQVMISPSVRRRLHDPFRPERPSISGGIGTGGSRVPSAPEYDRELAQLFIPVAANARSASIELRTKSNFADPYPGPATAILNDRAGTFGGIAAGATDALYYELLAYDGAGVPGEPVYGAFNAGAGAGINWLGEFAAHPADPQTNDVYRNTTDGIVYIWDGDSWEVMARDGLPGTGTGLEVRYSGPAAGQNINATFNPALHVYMQVRRTDQAWPTEWVPIVGEDGAPGADGVYFDYRFRVAETQPATPTGTNPVSWFDAPPAHDPSTGAKLWMSRALKNAADGSLLGAWSTPTQLTGPQGPEGPEGPVGPPGDTFGDSPIARIVATAETTGSVSVQYEGELGANATGPLQWRRRINSGANLGTWGPGAGDGWVTAADANALPFEEAVGRHANLTRALNLEVRDANGQTTSAMFLIVAADITAGGLRAIAAINDTGGGYALAPDVTVPEGQVTQYLTDYATQGWVNLQL
ncbi:MAG: hypothetical protein ACYC28_16120, partial [Longimicrobiales bacterium]